MTTPAGPAAPRDQLDQLILKHWRTPTSGCTCGQVGLGQSWSLHLTDALAPIVEALAVQRAAEELVAMADAVRTTEVLFRRDDGSGVKFGDLLRNRAAALRSTPAPLPSPERTTP